MTKTATISGLLAGAALLTLSTACGSDSNDDKASKAATAISNAASSAATSAATAANQAASAAASAATAASTAVSSAATAASTAATAARTAAASAVATSTPTPTGTAAAPAASGTTAGGTAQAQAITVNAGERGNEFYYDPKAITVKPGTVTITLNNQGPDRPHTFYVKNKNGNGDLAKTDRIEPGQTGTLTFTLEAGTYDFYCNLPGHADRGQKGTFTVQ